MAGKHPLDVEAMAQVEADREREVADPLVEPSVEAAHDTLGKRDGVRGKLVGVERGHAGGQARRPFLGVRAPERERDAHAVAESGDQTLHDPAVEEGAGGERVGDDDPDRLRRHAPVRPGSASATRSARLAPSSP